MNRSCIVHVIRTRYADFINYCYLVEEVQSKTAFIVDPSWEMEKILRKLEELQVQLRAVLLTHSHFDHTNLVEPLIDLYNPEVYMSQREINDYHYQCRNIHGVHNLEELTLGNTSIQCLLTPGHTSGGMCYRVADYLFSGDTLFSEGCGSCFGQGGSADQMFESIQKLRRAIPPETIVFPGHSFGMAPGQTMRTLLNQNIYFQFTEREDFVRFRMRGNQSSLLNFK
ncbi:polyketide biosynthesis protein [Paenibacillus helianthi]|uniref:Polyketide biosynthesis protein n=2 Tax=Paenibacillus helianthi TaxID=1349432 RepID=A0ABX3EKL8_9BACL|nr:polyketide biosynthesis protein [Paenibacillus helianthi]